MKLLLALVLLALAAALLFGPARAQVVGVWTINVISIDYEKGEITLRLVDFDAIVRSHNRKVDEIERLRGALCT